MHEAGEIEDFVALGLALNIAYLKEKHPIYMISDGISDKEAEKIGFMKFKSIDEAIEAATNDYGISSKINILPNGGETCPLIE